jgi:hypothetical protein
MKSLISLIALTLLVSCSSQEKDIRGVEINKLVKGRTSYLSITDMYGKPHKEVQLPNSGKVNFASCGKKTDYLIAQEYKLSGSLHNDDRVTLFYDKMKVLCHFEVKDFDL